MSALQEMRALGRRGLVALGDSITVGEGAPMLGLACRPWALWLAAALELPYTSLARNGAAVADLLHEQRHRLCGPYELGCVYIGVNDVRDARFDPAAYERDLDAIIECAGRACDHVLMSTIPLDLGRPRAGYPVREANEAIRRVAGASGASVISLEGLRGWRSVLPDAVHLTALGQARVAAMAAQALAADQFARGQLAAVGLGPERLTAAAAPAELEEARLGWGPSAGYALDGHARTLVRDLARRRREARADARAASS